MLRGRGDRIPPGSLIKAWFSQLLAAKRENKRSLFSQRNIMHYILLELLDVKMRQKKKGALKKAKDKAEKVRRCLAASLQTREFIRKQSMDSASWTGALLSKQPLPNALKKKQLQITKLNCVHESKCSRYRDTQQ